MSRSFSLLAICLFVVGALPGAPTSKEFHRTVPLSANGRVELRSDRGIDRITSWDRHDVEVFATIEARPESASPEESVRRTDIHFDASPNSVYIQTDFGNRMWTEGWFGNSDPNPLVRYQIKVPRNVELTIVDDRSEIEIGDIVGRLRLHTDRSSVEVASLNGPLSVEADRGSIRISRLVLADRGEFRTDRTEVELGINASHGMNLDLDLDRVSPTVDEGLLSGLLRESQRHVSYRGSIGQGGPTLRYSADRGSLRLRRI